jgi:hypothetical protein
MSPTKTYGSRQISNRNFLTPSGFKFTLSRAPKVSFFSNTANIPSVSLGVANQSSYLSEVPVPGDKMYFEDFTLTFLVDEDLSNYMEIQNWIRGIGFPESLNEIYKFESTSEDFESQYKSDMNLYSDGTLLVLNSNQNTNFQVKFRGMFPYSLSTLSFDATLQDAEYFTADVSFKYLMYNIVDRVGNDL